MYRRTADCDLVVGRGCGGAGVRVDYWGYLKVVVTRWGLIFMKYAESPAELFRERELAE